MKMKGYTFIHAPNNLSCMITLFMLSRTWNTSPAFRPV